MTIGERIKARREYLGITQEELAKNLGYKSKASINKIELGHQELTQKKIYLCAKLLDMPIKELMGWTDEEQFVQDTVPRLNATIEAKQRFGTSMKEKEIRIVKAYREADKSIQIAVDKLLDVRDISQVNHTEDNLPDHLMATAAHDINAPIGDEDKDIDIIENDQTGE